LNRFVRALLNRILGREGERAAARYLRRRGFRVITRGYSTNLGEIDLIARDGDTLVFIEVKTRRAGEPLEAVTPAKERRLTLTALQFLRRYGLLEQRCRFDVVAVHWPDAARTPSIEHVINAFEPPGRGQFFR
jgi:putative endonuclease